MILKTYAVIATIVAIAFGGYIARGKVEAFESYYAPSFPLSNYGHQTLAPLFGPPLGKGMAPDPRVIHEGATCVGDDGEIEIVGWVIDNTITPTYFDLIEVARRRLLKANSLTPDMQSVLLSNGVFIGGMVIRD